MFSKFLRNRELWRVERGGGLIFHENKKCCKKVIFANFLDFFFFFFFFFFLVDMVISIEHTICRVLKKHDN